jgi:hypothetical protein
MSLAPAAAQDSLGSLQPDDSFRDLFPDKWVDKIHEYTRGMKTSFDDENSHKRPGANGISSMKLEQSHKAWNFTETKVRIYMDEADDADVSQNVASVLQKCRGLIHNVIPEKDETLPHWYAEYYGLWGEKETVLCLWDGKAVFAELKNKKEMKENMIFLNIVCLFEDSFTDEKILEMVKGDMQLRRHGAKYGENVCNIRETVQGSVARYNDKTRYKAYVEKRYTVMDIPLDWLREKLWDCPYVVLVKGFAKDFRKCKEDDLNVWRRGGFCFREDKQDDLMLRHRQLFLDDGTPWTQFGRENRSRGCLMREIVLYELRNLVFESEMCDPESLPLFTSDNRFIKCIPGTH